MKKFLIAAGILVLTLIIFTIFFLDSLIENKIESFGTNIAGARVEVDGFSLSLLSMSAEWDRLQFTDQSNTMKNLFETGECKFDMEFMPLLNGSFLIEEIKATGIKTNTDRATDGKVNLPNPIKKEKGLIAKTTDAIKSKVKNAPVFNLGSLKNKINADSIIKIVNLETPGKIDSLNNHWKDKYSEWNKNLDYKKFETKLNEIKTKVDNIKVDNLNNVANVVTAISTVSEVKNDVETIKSDILNIKNNLTTDLSNASNSLSTARSMLESDYQKVINKAKLPDLNIKNIATVLFGKSLADELNQYLYYINQIRDMTEGNETIEEPQPFDPEADPTLWVKKLELSGILENGLNLAGSASNISSDQRLSGEPMNIRLDGSNNNILMSLSGLFDYRNTSKEVINYNYENFSIAGINLIPQSVVENKLNEGTGSVKAKINLGQNNFGGEIDFTTDDFNFEFKRSKNDMHRILADIISGLNTLKINTSLSGSEENINFNISSNLDSEIMKGFNKTLKAEVAKLKDKLVAEVDKKIGTKFSNFENLIQTKNQVLSGDLSSLTTLLESNISEIADKNKALQKKKEELEKSVGKKLLDIFK